MENNKAKTIEIETLSRAFDRVKNAEHWKNPIDAVIRCSELEITKVAVLHFTATELRVVESYASAPPRYRVRAVGYRAGLAGDH